MHNQTSHHSAQEVITSLLEPYSEQLHSQETYNQTVNSQGAHNQTADRHLEKLGPEGTASVTSASLQKQHQESSAAQGAETQASKPFAGSLNARLVEEAQRIEAERIERERLAAEAVEAGRLAAERLQAEGLEAQRLATLEAQGGAVAAQTEQPQTTEQTAVEQPVQVQEDPVPLHEPCKELIGTKPRRSRKLDIVIAHYDPQRIDSMSRFWLWFFSLEVVSRLHAYDLLMSKLCISAFLDDTDG